MKAAIGNTLVLSIMVTFISIVLLVLISSIVYTKAFRIKNTIVDEIEKRETYDPEVESTLTSLLRDVGYLANPLMNNANCQRYADRIDASKNPTPVNLTSPYKYCVIKLDGDGEKGGYYYKVVTFAYLDLPLVSAIQIPVYGETVIFYND